MPQSLVLTAVERDPTTIPTDPDALLTTEQVGAWLQLDMQTLSNMRWKKRGPVFLKLGGGRTAPVRYRRRDVESWLADQLVRTDGGHAA